MKDILSMKPNKKISGAICMGNSFGYFNFDKMKLFIEKLLYVWTQAQNLLSIPERLTKVFCLIFQRKDLLRWVILQSTAPTFTAWRQLYDE